MNSTQIPNSNSPTPTDIQHARDLFREIGALAATAMRMARDGISTNDEDDLDSLQTRLQVLRLVVERIGWVSDLGLRKLGDAGAFASAEDWMLPGA